MTGLNMTAALFKVKEYFRIEQDTNFECYVRPKDMIYVITIVILSITE